MFNFFEQNVQNTNIIQHQWNEKFPKMWPKSCSEKELLVISHTQLPISQSTSKMQNTKSATGVICKANDDIFHVILVLCKNQNSLYVKRNIFSMEKKIREKNLVTQNIVDINKIYQARNQEFFRIREFSWNYGTFIKIHLQQE